MTDIVLTSPHPNVPLVRRSIFTHLLGTSSDATGLVGGFPGTSPAFIDAPTGTVLTRTALRSYALQFAYSLHHLPAPLAQPLHSVSPPPVLIFSPNSIVWPILLHGVAAAGLRATLANSAYTPSELAQQYVDAGAHLVFTHPALVHVVQEALASLDYTESDVRSRVVLITSHWLTGMPDPVSTGLAHLVNLGAFLGRGALPTEVSFDGERSDETLLLCYSSGTTGKPKGVETTHYNLVSLVEILGSAWPASIPFLTPTFPEDRRAPQPDVFFGPMPYYHIYGAVILLMFPLSFGTPTVVIAGFNPVEYCEAVERYRASNLFVVPPMLVVLARHEAVEKYDMTSIRFFWSGAAPLGEDLVKTLKERLQKRGADVIVSQAYGLTETSPTVTLLHPNDAHTHIGSIGRVLPNLEVKLVCEDAGQIITNVDNAGEIWVRGPTVMKGYLNNPSEMASAITPDRWFKTGDIAAVDAQGFLTIINRRKELIKYKGFQVAPAELEMLLLQRPDVADAAVIGVYSEQEATELPRAYIVPTRALAPDASAALAIEILAWIAHRVAGHKRLRGGIVVVDQILKSTTGKILRRALHERAKGETGHGQVVPQAKL